MKMRLLRDDRWVFPLYDDVMAKGEKRRQENTEAGVSPAQKTLSESLVERAFAAYDDGDALMARRWAHKASEQLSSPLEQQAALKLVKKLWPQDEQKAEHTPEQVLAEIVRRPQVPLNSYAFALLALGVIVLMLILAHYRGA